MRKYIIGYFGCMLNFTNPRMSIDETGKKLFYSNNYIKNFITYDETEGKLKNKNKIKNDKKVGDFLDFKSIKIQNKPSNNHNDINDMKKTNINTNFFENNLSNKNLAKTLEKMIIKLQKSFDPIRLKDENLKYQILKEILECQRNLILTKKRENEASVHAKDSSVSFAFINDEWKILAMILDRICFSIYLSFFIISIIMFFFTEKIHFFL